MSSRLCDESEAAASDSLQSHEDSTYRHVPRTWLDSLLSQTYSQLRIDNIQRHRIVALWGLTGVSRLVVRQCLNIFPVSPAPCSYTKCIWKYGYGYIMVLRGAYLRPWMFWGGHKCGDSIQEWTSHALDLLGNLEGI